jgi:regulator of protease activity HflC (stomatin/prohibitin superfamily)
MSPRSASHETTFPPFTAWLIIGPSVLNIVGVIGAAIVGGEAVFQTAPWVLWLLLSVALTFTSLFGYFIVPPNMSRVLVLFGKYRGTVRTAGFYWTNPFTLKHQVSLRAHNIASETIKVNDIAGNPIEIGAVVVWQVTDTAQAMFDVERYQTYVDIQIETAVRDLAKLHPYDEGQHDSKVVSLRGDTEEVATELVAMLLERLERAGVEVLEARISHLAYAPEIASAMLQRQQASAIVAAREKIVEGAVGMVKQALTDLAEQEVVELDADRRATLVGNLLVVLCGQATPQPVLNTGSLYN